MSSAIEVINLTKQYTNALAVDRINFEVEEGEIFGFLGPSLEDVFVRLTGINAMPRKGGA